jgi:hypothetical protein
MFKFLRNSNSNSLEENGEVNNFCWNSAHIRLEKDLIELKRYPLRTKMFNTQVSDVLKDEVSENFKMFVSCQNLENLNLSYNVNINIFIEKLIIKKNFVFSFALFLVKTTHLALLLSNQF